MIDKQITGPGGSEKCKGPMILAQNVNERQRCAKGQPFVACLMGAADSHLAKLDRIQTSAERICGFKMESLSSRRDAAAFSLAVKMLSGKGRGILNDFTPQLYHIPESTNSTRTRSSSLTGFQVQSQITTKSLDVTRRGFAGAIPRIFAALPQPWIKFGVLNGWHMIEARCKQFLLSPNMLVEVKSSGRTVTSRRKI